MGDYNVDLVDGKNGGLENEMPPAAALIRRPAMRVRYLIMAGLRAGGHADILPAHLGVFQYPGPDGQRPGVLAVRNHASKQAMNHLLHQLEVSGYIVREQHPRDGRTRVVRLTGRGWSAAEVIRKTVDEIEASWAEALGETTYAELRHALVKLEAAMAPAPDRT